MKNDLIEELDIYTSKLNYSKFINLFKIKKSTDIKDIINDINAPLFTVNILNLGEELLKLLDFQMDGWTFFINKEYDRLEDEIKNYDINNNSKVLVKLDKWYKDNIRPFYKVTENKLNDYSFAALSIRFFLICQTIEKTDSMLKTKPHSKGKSINDKYGLKHDDWFYIFNDYLINDLDEKDYTSFCINKLELSYKNVTIKKIREYAFKLFNELDKRYNLINIKCTMFYDEKVEKSIALYYHLTPISVAYNHLISKLCNKDIMIKQCKYCNQFMEVKKSSKEYHDDCFFEKEKQRKR